MHNLAVREVQITLAIVRADRDFSDIPLDAINLNNVCQS